MAKGNNLPIYEELAQAYDFYNKELFGNLLPRCIIVLSRKLNTLGYFMPNNFISNDENDIKLHEIALNVQMFAVRKLELTLSTLVHEMCHLKTFEDGDYGRGAYHNKKWARIMKERGLLPTTTGELGGNEVGQSVTHLIQPGGEFERKTEELVGKGFLIPFVERIKSEVKSYTEEEIRKKAVAGKPGFYKDENGEVFEGKAIKCGKDEKGKEIIKVLVNKNNRAVYSCKCGIRVWGKSGLSIRCNNCEKNLKEE
jgi:predicted SprT family Zn-dependent metalloprotease